MDVIIIDQIPYEIVGETTDSVYVESLGTVVRVVKENPVIIRGIERFVIDHTIYTDNVMIMGTKMIGD